jgi:hypothetical protein
LISLAAQHFKPRVQIEAGINGRRGELRPVSWTPK